MSDYLSDDGVLVFLGDCRDLIRTLSDASVDAVVTDPPYELGFMGKGWDGSGIAYSVDLWSQALRVLKPGGYLLAFGGTRTCHRMACAVEDAGFEIRDSLTWLYGSGFPKSRRVSADIDRQLGMPRDRVELVGGALNAGTANGWNGTDPHSATAQLAGTRADDEPRTPEGRQWQGWGTALKPASEPIVLARKPLAGIGTNVLNHVESALRAQGVTGEIQWTSRNGSALNAGSRTRSRTSSATPQQGTDTAFVDPAAASVTQHCASESANDSAPSPQPGETPTANTSASTADGKTPSYGPQSSTPTATPAPAVTSDSPSSSPSTTSTAAVGSTGEPSSARSTSRSAERDSLPTTGSFAGIATGLTGSRATVHIERLADGTFVWPDGLPRSVPGGPATVAATVLAHGTGALNIDGCRTAHASAADLAESLGKNPGRLDVVTSEVYGAGRPQQSVNAAGRWPTNVVLSHLPTCTDLCAPGCAVAELDAQSGTLKSGKLNRANIKAANAIYGQQPSQLSGEYEPNEGGASRFFPTFRYQAKAPTRERPKVDGVAHPTVKPLSLMSWLVRLVTPPGGLVLDPFAGSGTTLQAARDEGMRALGFELTPEYLPLIAQRLGIELEREVAS